MIFPKGPALYENLSTAFVQFDPLLAELKSSRFTGSVCIAGWEYDGALLLDAGSLVNAIDERGGQRTNGEAAREAIVAAARGKDCAVSVYRLEPEVAQVLAGYCAGEQVDGDRAVDSASLDALISRLRQVKHTGYVEVQLADHGALGSIFMRDGEVIGAILGSDSVVGYAAPLLSSITQLAKTGSSAKVFRVDLAKVYSGRAALDDNSTRQNALALWLGLLTIVERETDRLFKPGVFLVAFKRACIELATAYPFLDPFAAEFVYRDGWIRYEGSTTASHLNEGLTRCLDAALHALAQEPHGVLLEPQLRIALTDLRSGRAAELREARLVEALPGLFGA